MKNIRLSKDLALKQAQIQQLKEIDVFSDLNDLDYLNNLEKRIKSIVARLSSQNIVSTDPLEKSKSDIQKIKESISFFNINTQEPKYIRINEWEPPINPKTKRAFSKSSKKYKTELANFYVNRSTTKDQIEKDLFNQTSKFKNLRNSLANFNIDRQDDCFDHDLNICPILIEIDEIISPGDSKNKLSNVSPDLFSSFLSNKKRFIEDFDKEVTNKDPIIVKLSRKLEEWEELNSESLELQSYWEKGLTDKIASFFEKSKIFSDFQKYIPDKEVWEIARKHPLPEFEVYNELNSNFIQTLKEAEWASNIVDLKEKLKRFEDTAQNFPKKIKSTFDFEELNRIITKRERILKENKLESEKKQRTSALIWGSVILLVLLGISKCG